MFGYKKLYIGGRLVDAVSENRQTVYCPATDAAIGEIAWAGIEDTRNALAAAENAFESWSQTSVSTRVEIMKRLRHMVEEREDDLRSAEMFEHGKTWEQTREGFDGVVSALDFYATEIQRVHGHLLADVDGTHEHKIVYRSAGVVGAFIAWNFPLLNFAFKLGPALATGSPLIIRPSAETPISAYILGEICAAAELPPGTVNILTGSIAETADPVVKSTVPSVLSLIGSTRTGLEIMKNGASSVKRFSMELGGNAPALVFPDADIENAVDVIAMLKFSNAGQACVAPNRIYVHEDVRDAFVSGIVKKAREVVIGHGRDSGATMGPVISKPARDRIDSWVKDAVSAGARLHYGGRIPDGMEDRGAFYMPTVLDNVSDGAKLSCEEIFGPVASILSFRDYNEVIERANRTPMGLASYVFTQNQSTASSASKDLDFGEVQVNGVKYGMDLPHIGIKQSGIGLDGSHFALEEYMVKKRITTALNR